MTMFTVIHLLEAQALLTGGKWQVWTYLQKVFSSIHLTIRQGGKKYLTFDKTDSFMCFIQAPTTEHLDKFSTFVLFFSLLMQAAMPKTSGCTSSTILGIDTQIQYNHVLKSVSHVLYIRFLRNVFTCTIMTLISILIVAIWVDTMWS
jgi:hypothetical protein